MNGPKEDVIARILDGETRAWAELVDRYQGLVLSVARRSGLGEEDAEEVFQTTWMMLYKNLALIQKPGAVTSWIITTASREAWRLRRDRDRRRTGDEELLESTPTLEPRPEELIESVERIELVRESLGRLGERCRDLLSRLYVDPAAPSYQDVARELGIPLGSVGPTRLRCIAKLADLLRMHDETTH